MLGFQKEREGAQITRLAGSAAGEAAFDALGGWGAVFIPSRVGRQQLLFRLGLRRCDSEQSGGEK